MVRLKEVYFGGGCFWCTEAVFRLIRGVSAVTSGYAGGDSAHPSYESVSTGETNHAEVVRVRYNPQDISLHELLIVFFGSHDPTVKNRQGADIGTQYRSIVLVSSPEEEAEVRTFIAELNNSEKEGRPIVTEVKQIEVFYEAEAEHQDYYTRNQTNRYCELVINPKLEKVQKAFAALLAERRQTPAESQN